MYTRMGRYLQGIHPSISATTRALALAVLMSAASLQSPVSLAGEHALPLFLTRAGAPVPIDCGDTPFGDRVVMGHEDEFVDLLTTNGGARGLGFSQFDADTGTSVPWIDTPIPGAGTFDPWDVVGVDLNGDGRDEAVVASSIATGGVRLDVYAPDGQGGAAVIDVWRWATQGAIQDVQLLAGDFDGSLDDRQEFGVLVRFDQGIELFILTGDDNGGIAQANGDAAGYWKAPSDASNLSIAAGDVLLDGHDQIVVAYLDFDPGNVVKLHYHLLEYATAIPNLLPVAPGNDNIGSKELVDDISDGFQYEYGSGLYPDNDSIDRIDLAVGNVVDSAAAELVTFFGYEDSGEFYHISMRLQHVDTTRDADNNITSIAFAIRPDGQPFDSAVEVGNWSNSAASFDGLVADVELASKPDPDTGLAEIVLANAPNGYERIDLYAYKVHVKVIPGFLWSSNGMQANFSSASAGAATNYYWDFGDGNTVQGVANPSHTYATGGSFTVLHGVEGPPPASPPAGSIAEQQVQIDDGSHNGGAAAPHVYVIDQNPAYQGSYDATGTQSPGHLNVAAGDLDGDAKDEIVTVATLNGPYILRSVWRTVGPAFVGEHRTTPFPGAASAVQLDTLDFDGDTVQATISTDCRKVQEPQLRQVVWLPPYFERLQSAAAKEAAFGLNISSGTESQNEAGSYTSHSISGYLGFGTAAAGGGGTIQAILRATAGVNFQKSQGAISGSGHERNVHQGLSQDTGEALVVVENNQFLCYTYDVSTQASGELPDSGLRMCEQISGSKFVTGTDAVAWDSTIPDYLDHPPAAWVPLHRDWSSIALFHLVSSNAQFIAGNGPDKATDGLFSTEAQSDGSSTDPWLEVDLGSEQEISNIRVFPSDGNVADLVGARIVASATPIGNPPWGPEVHVFQPETEDGTMYNRWDAWTRDPDQPDNLLKARHVRVLLPGNRTVHIAEIQVFGPVHVEPPRYPDAICDDDLSDGVFQARIWDPANGVFRAVEVHGDLLWDGTWTASGGTPWGSCNEPNDLPNASIWENTLIGGSASVDWTLSDTNKDMVGSTTGFDNAIRAGAAFDFQAGAGAAIAFGASYEFATGLTVETQTSSYWSHGLETGGAIEGFAPQFSGLIDDCGYNPRPYAYHLREYSITGYPHDIYVVDYTVHQGPGTWQRGNISILCSRADLIFENGFE